MGHLLLKSSRSSAQIIPPPNPWSLMNWDFFLWKSYYQINRSGRSFSPDHCDVVIADPLTASLGSWPKSTLTILNHVPSTRLNLNISSALRTVLVSYLVADLIVGKEATGPGELSSLAPPRCWSIQALVGSC